MVREASAFLLNRLFSTAASADWLAPPQRQHMINTLILPYLTSLSFHVSSAFFPPLLTPPLTLGQPGTSLSAAAATATTVISLIQELFPRTLGPGPKGGMQKRFPSVEALRVEVESRPRIAAWIASGERATEWTRSEHGSSAFIAAQAEKYDVEESASEQAQREKAELAPSAVGEEAECDTGM